MLQNYDPQKGYHIVVASHGASAADAATTIASIFKKAGLNVAIDKRNKPIRGKLIDYTESDAAAFVINDESVATSQARIFVPNLSFGFFDRNMRESINMLLDHYGRDLLSLDRLLPGETNASLTLARGGA